MTLSVREKILITLLAIAVIVFLGVKFLVMPEYNKNKGNLAELDNLTSRQLVAQQQVGAMKTESEGLQKALSSADSAAASLLPQLEIDKLNVWLVNLIQGSGLRVSSISFTQPASTNIAGGAASQGSTSSAAADNDYLLGQYAQAYKNGTPVNAQQSTGSAKSASSSSAAAAKSAGGVLGVSATVTLSGNYSQAKAFLDKVEGSGKTVTVTAFACSVSGTTYTITATLQCYGAEKLDSADGTFNWTLPKPAGKGDVM